jgi:hypothetical protein
MEAKLKHLELIQGVVNRMAANSFSLKGWSVVLVSALFALAAANPGVRFYFLAYFPAIAFWILDAYFLRQECLFRKLYDAVRSLPDAAIDFSMDTTPYVAQVQSWLRTAFSTTLFIFHGIVTLIITLVTLVALAS